MSKKHPKQIQVVSCRECTLEDLLLDLCSVVAHPAPSNEDQPWLVTHASNLSLATIGAIQNRVRGNRAQPLSKATDSLRADFCQTAGAKLLARLLDPQEEHSDFFNLKITETLRAMALKSEGVQKIAESESLSHLVQIAGDYVGSLQPDLKLGTKIYDEAQLVETALEALRNVSTYQEPATEITELGIVAPLVAALHDGPPLTKLLAAASLVGLMQHRILLPVLRDHGVLKPFLGLLQDVTSDLIYGFLGANGVCALAEDNTVLLSLPQATGPPMHQSSKLEKDKSPKPAKNKLTRFVASGMKKLAENASGSQKSLSFTVPQIFLQRLQFNHPENFNAETDLNEWLPSNQNSMKAKTSEAVVLCLLKLIKVEEHRKLSWVTEFVQPLLQQLVVGTEKSCSAALNILELLHAESDENKITVLLCSPLVQMLNKSGWEVKVTSAKTMLSIYSTLESKILLLEAGAIGALLQMITESDELIVQHPLATLIHLASLPEAPTEIVEKDGLRTLSQVVEKSMGTLPVQCINRILCLGILKACYIYHSRCDFFINDCPPWILHDIKHCPEELESFILEVVSLRKTTEYFEIPPERAAWFLPEELEMIKNNFKELDEDASGAIDVDELENLLRKLGQKPNRKKVLKLIEEVDEDKSGEIEFNEFLMVMKLMKEGKATGFGSLLQTAFAESLQEFTKQTKEAIHKYFYEEEILMAQLAEEEAARRKYLQEMKDFTEEFWEEHEEKIAIGKNEAYQKSLTAERKNSIQMQRYR